MSAMTPEELNEALSREQAAAREWHEKTKWVQQEFSSGKLPPTYWGWHRADIMKAEVMRLRQRIAELERDAGRYRFITSDPISWEETDGINAYILICGERTWRGLSLDAAIDAAMQAQTEEGGK